MKKLALLLILSFALSLSACMSPADTPSDSSGGTENAADAQTNAAVEDTREHSDAVKTANEALFELFPALEKIGTAPFEITESENANDPSIIGVRYEFMLCGMNTYEQYYIRLIKNGDGFRIEKDNCYGSGEGDYTKFYFDCTEEKIAAAKAELDGKLDSEEENSGYYLQINDDGALILQCEQIIHLSAAEALIENPPCGDHKHVFYDAIVCE